MSPRTKRKQGLALQIALYSSLLLFVGCAGNAVKAPVHHSSGDQAKTLRHVQTISSATLGADLSVKNLFFGRDKVKFGRPVAVGVREDLMMIADADSGVIYRYNLKNNTMRLVRGSGDKVLGEVTDIYVRKDESFLVTDNLGKRALYFSPAGKLIRIYQSGPNLSRPIAVSWDEKKNEILVADEMYSHVVAFDEAGEPKYGIGGRGIGEGKFRIITDMLKTDDGMYVSDRIELAVQKLDDQGRFVRSFGEEQVVFPTAIAEDKYGRLFVADKADSKIKVFADGKMIDVVGRNGYVDGEFRLISDMKIQYDRMYLTDSLNGRVQIFDILPPSVAFNAD